MFFIPFECKFIRIVVLYLSNSQNNFMFVKVKFQFYKQHTKFFVGPINLDVGNKPEVSFF